MNKTTNRIQRLNETLSPPSLITESKHPANSINGLVDAHMWPQFMGTISSTVGTKYVTFRDHKTISLGLWMFEFNGYTRSDVTATGTISMSAPSGGHKVWSIDFTFRSADMARDYEQTWELSPFEDYMAVAKEIAHLLKRQIEG